MVSTVLDFAEEIGFHPVGLSFSPIKGPEGNIEYLAYLKKDANERTVTEEDIKNVVDSSHSELSR